MISFLYSLPDLDVAILLGFLVALAFVAAPLLRARLIYADLVKITDQLVESREDRLTAADLGLPPIFWEVIAFLLVLLVGFAAFVEPQRGRAISLGGLGIGLALLITLVFIFDQPFLGDMSVTPEPIVKVLRVMRARTS